MIPLFITAFLCLPDVDYNPVQRAVATSEATLTGDAEEVFNADGSAAARVAPVLNAFKMDFSDPQTWLGYGTEVANRAGYSDERYTIWTDRGVVSYFIGLLLVFSCAIKPFLSLATLLFLCALGGSLINVYYIWGILMTLTCVSHFHNEQKEVQK